MTTPFRFPLYDDEVGVFGFPEKKELKIESIPEWKKEKDQQPAIYHRKQNFVKPKWSTNKENKKKSLPIEIEPYASYDEPDQNEIEEINLLSNKGTVQQQLKKVETEAETKVQEEIQQEELPEVNTEIEKSIEEKEEDAPLSKEGGPTSIYAQFANSISPEEKQRKQQQEEEFADTKDKLPQIKESIQRVRATQRADIPFCRKQTERSKEGRK